jgi:hypothetical protein
MITDNKIQTAAIDGANTTDIIGALCSALPAAVNQIEPGDLPPIQPRQNKVKYLYDLAQQIQKDIKYKADGFDLQKIQLPGRLYTTKIGDCKSLSLLFLALATKAGFTGGFRFVSFRSNKIPTHVYNFILINGKKVIFDLCTPYLKESKKYTYNKDMRVQYLSGVPVMVQDSADYLGINGKEEREARRKARQDRRDDSKNQGKPAPGKKLFLAPVRGSFLLLVEVNFRGIATKLDKLNKKNPTALKNFWLKLGGDPSKLLKLVDKTKDKKPLFGAKLNGLYNDNEEYIGFDPATLTAAATAAAAVLAAVSKLLKKEGVPIEEELAPAGTPPLDPTGQGFEAADPEPGAKTPGPIVSFKPSPLLIGGGIAAIALIFFLTRKKAKR